MTNYITSNRVFQMVERAMQLLGRGAAATAGADESEPASRRTSARRLKRTVQGAGLSLLGEFVQMVAV